MFRVQLYKNNARTLFSRILKILNSDWLQHARSVRGVYEVMINLCNLSFAWGKVQTAWHYAASCRSPVLCIMYYADCTCRSHIMVQYCISCSQWPIYHPHNFQNCSFKKYCFTRRQKPKLEKYTLIFNSQIWETRNLHFWTHKFELAFFNLQLTHVNSQLTTRTRNSQVVTRNFQNTSTHRNCL